MFYSSLRGCHFYEYIFVKWQLLFFGDFAHLAQRGFFNLAKYIPGDSLSVVCFSTDEQRERRVTFYTNTGEKILRLPATENKVSIGDDISKRDLRLERAEMSSKFCFLWQTIFIRIFANSVCIKRTRLLPVYSFGKIYFIENKESLGI